MCWQADFVVGIDSPSVLGYRSGERDRSESSEITECKYCTEKRYTRGTVTSFDTFTKTTINYCLVNTLRYF